MLKLIVGVKGTGKTKQLIEMVNGAIDSSKGDVVCIEKGDKLKFDVNYRCRLIDADSFGIKCACSLYGFVAGILASNHDVTDLYIDSALKICKDDIGAFDDFLKQMEPLVKANPDVNFVITASIEQEKVSDTVKKYL